LRPRKVEGGLHFCSNELHQSYVKHVETVADLMMAELRKISGEDQSDLIVDIIREASDLAFLMGRERCRIQLFAPKKIEHIDIHDPAISDRNDEHNGSSGLVSLVVHPGLKKIPEEGEETILCPAEVFLTGP
jgi:hypothetical protein